MHQLFRLWLGATEFLFRQPGLLDETLKAAIEDKTFRSDDLEFTFAARVSHLLSPPTLLCGITSLFAKQASLQRPTTNVAFSISHP